MSYKSILTYCDTEPASEVQVSAAIEVTRSFDAHLTIAAVGYEPDIPPNAFASGSGFELAELFERSRAQAAELTGKASEMLTRQALKGDAVPLVSTYGALGMNFGDLARFADLVVLCQPTVATDESAAERFIEGALFSGDAAVLICPRNMPQPVGNKIVIGWNGDRETLRAVRRAMPFLMRASSIEIAVIDPPGGAGSPGADLATLLARHGLDPQVSALPSAGLRVSEVLSQCMSDLDADLLVMGAYGHSRFREYIIGGATRDIILEARVPVLMAH